MRMPLASSYGFTFPLSDGSHARESQISKDLNNVGRCGALLTCAAVLLLASVPGWSQSASSLTGTVKDPTGAAVGKAIVRLVNDASSVRKEVPTGDSGAYEFKDLALGSYTVEVVAPGFSTFGTRVMVGAEAATLDVALEVAATSSAVSVEAKIDPVNILPTQPT